MGYLPIVDYFPVIGQIRGNTAMEGEESRGADDVPVHLEGVQLRSGL